jgi:hypothetical protein
MFDRGGGARPAGTGGNFEPDPIEHPTWRRLRVPELEEFDRQLRERQRRQDDHDTLHPFLRDVRRQRERLDRCIVAWQAARRALRLDAGGYDLVNTRDRALDHWRGARRALRGACYVAMTVPADPPAITDIAREARLATAEVERIRATIDMRWEAWSNDRLAPS